jgi:hypothetical protein
MVNKYGLLLGLWCSLMASAEDTTVDQLDNLERQRVVLEKQLEVSKLQGELNESEGKSNVSPVVATEDLQSSSLHLIKVVGLASKPKAIFLYNGFRLSAESGQKVLPNVDLKNVTDTYVTLTDTKTGKDSILWLSNNSINGK